jgi:hypothetical protein
MVGLVKELEIIRKMEIEMVMNFNKVNIVLMSNNSKDLEIAVQN